MKFKLCSRSLKMDSLSIFKERLIMKKALIIGLIFTTSFSAKAQKLIVIDSITSEILPFASISYQKIENEDIIRISNIGYKTKIIKVNIAGDTIPLKPTSYILREVEVNVDKERTKYYDLGFHKEKRLFYNTFTTSALPFRVIAASKIFPKNDSDIIEGVYIRLKHKGEETSFKLFLMNVDHEGLPKDTILKKLLDAKEYKRMVYVDISDHYLSIPTEGIVVAFEWGLSNYDYSERKLSIVTTTKFKENFSYLFVKDKWNPYLEKAPFENFSFGFKMRER